jgi:hypothetical protein
LFLLFLIGTPLLARETGLLVIPAVVLMVLIALYGFLRISSLHKGRLSAEKMVKERLQVFASLFF